MIQLGLADAKATTVADDVNLNILFKSTDLQYVYIVALSCKVAFHMLGPSSANLTGDVTSCF